MKFPDAFLDELRAKVPVSVVVGRRYTLRKQGAEMVAAEDKSVTVNDKKGLWYDFGKGAHGGDIFEFLVNIEGLSFPEAVKTCASIAGLPLPGGESTSGSTHAHPQHKPNGNGAHRADDRPEPPPFEATAHGGADQRDRRLVRAYDYTDQEGRLIYQVVRFDPKEFRQRKPDGQDGWVWSIKDIQPLFYRLPELLEALSEERMVVLTEGEKDADTLWDWGVPATTNSGGAGHWGKQDLAVFKDADVVVAIDNDEAGRKRADAVALSLKMIAKRVRVLDFAAVWAEAPKGADVTDWKDHAGGTVERLYEITKSLPTWSPAPMHSKFGRIRWQDQEQPNLTEYEWWIKGVIPKRETIAVVGATQTGKSFETFNLGMHIARGVDYRGCRTKQGLVVYCAMEGGKGFRDRLRGYRAHHGLPLEGIPFEVLTRRANLFSSDTDLSELIAEIKAITAEHSHELALVVIDTYSAATPGLKENTSEDISRVRQKVVQIQDACNCGVLFVDHTNAVGDKVRGHTSKTADIETQLDVAWVTKREGKDVVVVEDNDKRKIRRLTVFKQREGMAGQHWDFVLKAVEVRKDADGDPVTTCVCVIPNLEAEDTQKDSKRAREGPKGEGFHLYKEGEAAVFKAIITALSTAGTPTPPQLKLPSSIRQVVRWSEVGLAYKARVPNDEGDTADGKRKYAERVKKTLKRAREALLGFGVIGIDQVTAGEETHHVVWPTGKKVWGPDLRWPPPQQAAVTAPSKDEIIYDDELGFGDEFK